VQLLNESIEKSVSGIVR